MAGGGDGNKCSKNGCGVETNLALTLKWNKSRNSATGALVDNSLRCEVVFGEKEVRSLVARDSGFEFVFRIVWAITQKEIKLLVKALEAYVGPSISDGK
jgi:hypothetical protein